VAARWPAARRSTIRGEFMVCKSEGSSQFKTVVRQGSVPVMALAAPLSYYFILFI